jgi:hypothetical protein
MVVGTSHVIFFGLSTILGAKNSWATFFTNFRVTRGMFSKIMLTPPFCPSICKSLLKAFFQSVCRVLCTNKIVLRGHYLISLSNFVLVTKNGQRGYGQPEKRDPGFRMVPASSFCLKILYSEGRDIVLGFFPRDISLSSMRHFMRIRSADTFSKLQVLSPRRRHPVAQALH